MIKRIIQWDNEISTKKSGDIFLLLKTCFKNVYGPRYTHKALSSLPGPVNVQTQNSFSLLYIILLVIDLGCVILKRKMMLREIQMIILIGFSLCLYFFNVDNHAIWSPFTFDAKQVRKVSTRSVIVTSFAANEI